MSCYRCVQNKQFYKIALLYVAKLKKISSKAGLFIINLVFEWKILSLLSINLYSKVRKLDRKILNNRILSKGDVA